MAKKLNSNDQAELEHLTERMLVTVAFVERVQDFPSGRETRELVEQARAKGDLRTARLMNREVTDLLTALAPHERTQLEAILRDRLGVNAEAERLEMQQNIARVLARGSVASEKERRRLEDYIELVEATGGDAAEVAAVRELLRRT